MGWPRPPHFAFLCSCRRQTADAKRQSVQHPRSYRMLVHWRSQWHPRWDSSSHGPAQILLTSLVFIVVDNEPFTVDFDLVARHEFPSPLGFDVSVDEHFATLNHQFGVPARLSHLTQFKKLVESNRRYRIGFRVFILLASVRLRVFTI